MYKELNERAADLICYLRERFDYNLGCYEFRGELPDGREIFIDAQYKGDELEPDIDLELSIISASGSEYYLNDDDVKEVEYWCSDNKQWFDSIEVFSD